ncbi:MAG: acyl-[acyl-carrier-protein] thioesterase [Eubacterium sp.]|nr:acyl-[acyl-carrier-protein] thioesterase [Eubacterium sp.]
MYGMNGRVRFSEVDDKKDMTLSALLNYFQDCSCFHSEDIGMGIDDMAGNGYAWILASWQIVIEEFPKYPDEIVVTTSPYDFKGTFGYRNFTMEDGNGRMYAYANSVWFLMDIKNGRPLKIPETVWSKYELSEKLKMDYAPRKIAADSQGCAKEPVTVQKSQLDVNEHVNNGQYLVMAQEYVPESIKVRQMRADYRKAAVLGDRIFPYVTEEQDKVTVQLCDEEKQIYAIVEFTE